MENFNQIIEYIARTNLFNFVIFASIIFWVVKKLRVSEKIEGQVNTVNASIEESKTAKADSEEKLSSIESSLAHIEEDINSIFAESDERANLVGEKILNDAQTNVSTIRDNSQKAFDNSVALLKNDLIKRAAKASIEAAKEHILDELNKNVELHNKLIDESLERLEGMEL